MTLTLKLELILANLQQLERTQPGFIIKKRALLMPLIYG